MMHDPNRSRGFTLLEILVAVGVFAIFSALAYGSLDRILASRDRIDAERQFWRQLAIAFTVMEDDLAMARGRTIRDNYGNTRPAFVGLPVDTRPQGEPAMAFTRGGVFVLSDSTRPDLLRVGYRLTDGKLLRLTWPTLDQANQVQPPQSAPLLEHVTDMRVRFYATNGGWLDAWPSPNGAPASLPAAVEITLTIEGRGQYQRILRVAEMRSS